MPVSRGPKDHCHTQRAYEDITVHTVDCGIFVVVFTSSKHVPADYFNQAAGPPGDK